MLILEDFKAKARWNYQEESILAILQAALSDASLCMIIFRIGSFFNKYKILKPASAFLVKINAILCGAVIGRNAKFGRRFVVLHSVGIVINAKVKCGDDIVLESGVVIGANNYETPELGNNIFIGSGAKIFGGIKIGNNVRIGANAVVNRDIPDNVAVAGVPAKIIKYLNS